MILPTHTLRQFAEAIKSMLPPGAAWRWNIGGLGDKIMLAAAAELVRVEQALQPVLDNAIETHRPAQASWHIDEYRRVANEALNGLTETMPRRPAGIGSHIGNRLWSASAPSETFPVALLQVDHLVGPAKIGSHIGDQLWGERSRYILRVRYYKSVVDPKPIWDVLKAFKQAHVFLWFEDITGVAGEVSYAQD